MTVPFATLLSALLFSLPLAAASAPDAQLKAALEGRYAAMKSAMAERDPAAIKALLAPDFESVDVDGKVETADQMVGEVLALPKDPSKVSDTTLLSVVQNADTVTVSQRYHMTKTKNRPDGTPQAVEILTTSTDIWVRSGDQWLLRRTATETLDYKIDGKSLLHKEHAPAAS
jgi:hypothetical protein